MLLWLQFQSHCLLLSDWGRTPSPWRWSHSLCFSSADIFLHTEVLLPVGICKGEARLIRVADGVGSPRQRKGGSFLPRPKSALLSNTQKLIFRGDTHAGKGRDFIGKGFPEERAGEPLCHMAHGLRFNGNGVSFHVVSGQSSCLFPYLV